MSWQWDASQEWAHLESGQKTQPRPNNCLRRPRLRADSCSSKDCRLIKGKMGQ